jgi:hypothetical protein
MATEQDIALHPANRAAHLYQSGTSQQTRRADQFFVVFNLYPLVNDDFLLPKYNFLKTFRDRLHFLCHTVEGPKFQIQQDVINQYNRKRVINRKVDYDPVSLRMYDTVDGLGLKFIKMLYEFEFQNARLYGSRRDSITEASRDNFQESVLTNESQFKQNHNFGMRSQPNHTHRIIKSIDLYQLAGTLYSRAKMIHPRLSRMDMDQFDYSSSAVTNLSMGFQYENLLFDEIAVKDTSLPQNVSTAFTTTSGKYEDWVRPNGPLAKDILPPPADGINSTIVTQDNEQGWSTNSNGSAVNNSAGDYWKSAIEEANKETESSDLQKSVTSKFSLESNPHKEKTSYDGGNTSTDTESESKASTEVLTAAGLTTEMHKAIKNGPSSNTKQSKKEYVDKIRTYEQAIKNKKKAEAANKNSIWT